MATSDRRFVSVPGGVSGVAVLAALAGLVAVATRDQPLWTLVREGYADRTVIVFNLAVLWIVGVLFAAAVAAFIHRAVVGRGANAPPFRATASRAAPAAAVVLSALSLLTIARTDLGRVGPPEQHFRGEMRSSPRPGAPVGSIDWWSGLVVVAGQGSEAQETPETSRQTDTALPLLPTFAGALVLALGVAGVWWWYGRRSGTRTASHPDASTDAREEAHGAIVSTIDGMLGDPDPNTAIIGAYARLLKELDARGTGRLEQEAPAEHLQRVLTLLSVRPAPLRELIELFAHARFSTHSLTAAHRDRALGALEAVADDLGGEPAAATPGGDRPPMGSRSPMGRP